MSWTFFNLHVRPAYAASSKLTNVKKPGKIATEENLSLY